MVFNVTFDLFPICPKDTRYSCVTIVFVYNQADYGFDP